MITFIPTKDCCPLPNVIRLKKDPGDNEDEIQDLKKTFLNFPPFFLFFI